jgi:hypothetical protein
MGEGNASKGWEKGILYLFAMAVWAVNATTLSMKGGGFFGEITPDMEWSVQKFLLVLLQVSIQLWYAWWNLSTLFGSVGGTKQSIGDAQFAYGQSEGPGEDEALSAVPAEEAVMI